MSLPTEEVVLLIEETDRDQDHHLIVEAVQERRHTALDQERPLEEGTLTVLYLYLPVIAKRQPITLHALLRTISKL